MVVTGPGVVTTVHGQQFTGCGHRSTAASAARRRNARATAWSPATSRASMPSRAAAFRPAAAWRRPETARPSAAIAGAGEARLHRRRFGRRRPGGNIGACAAVGAAAQASCTPGRVAAHASCTDSTGCGRQRHRPGVSARKPVWHWWPASAQSRRPVPCARPRPAAPREQRAPPVLPTAAAPALATRLGWPGGASGRSVARRHGRIIPIVLP